MLAFPINVRGRTVGVGSIFVDDAVRLRSPKGIEAARRLQANAIMQTEELVRQAQSIAVFASQGAHASTLLPMNGRSVATPDGPTRPSVDSVPNPPDGMAPPTSSIHAPSQSLAHLVNAMIGETVARLDAESDRAERMRESNQLKDEVIAVVSHELRNPLTSVLAYAELAANMELPPDKVKDFSARIHRESELMLRLVEDLLDLSPLESGRTSLELQPLDLEEEIDHICSSLRSKSERHKIAYECPAGLTAHADPIRLSQVLRNLITNAIHYSPDGGLIQVKAASMPRSEESAKMPSMVRIDVTDPGIGIPDSERELVFAKFYRVRSQLRRRVRGSGLGLSISQTIIESHGGRIWVDWSEPGKGSRFSFTVPVTPIPDAEPPAGDANEQTEDAESRGIWVFSQGQ